MTGRGIPWSMGGNPGSEREFNYEVSWKPPFIQRMSAKCAERQRFLRIDPTHSVWIVHSRICTPSVPYGDRFVLWLRWCISQESPSSSSSSKSTSLDKVISSQGGGGTRVSVTGGVEFLRSIRMAEGLVERGAYDALQSRLDLIRLALIDYATEHPWRLGLVREPTGEMAFPSNQGSKELTALPAMATSIPEVGPRGPMGPSTFSSSSSSSSGDGYGKSHAQQEAEHTIAAVNAKSGELLRLSQNMPAATSSSSSSTHRSIRPLFQSFPSSLLSWIPSPPSPSSILPSWIPSPSSLIPSSIPASLSTPFLIHSAVLTLLLATLLNVWLVHSYLSDLRLTLRHPTTLPSYCYIHPSSLSRSTKLGDAEDGMDGYDHLPPPLQPRSYRKEWVQERLKQVEEEAQRAQERLSLWRDISRQECHQALGHMESWLDRGASHHHGRKQHGGDGDGLDRKSE